MARRIDSHCPVPARTSSELLSSTAVMPTSAPETFNVALVAPPDHPAPRLEDRRVGRRHVGGADLDRIHARHERAAPLRSSDALLP